jgi:hypothetical protein
MRSKTSKPSFSRFDRSQWQKAIWEHHFYRTCDKTTRGWVWLQKLEQERDGLSGVDSWNACLDSVFLQSTGAVNVKMIRHGTYSKSKFKIDKVERWFTRWKMDIYRDKWRLLRRESRNQTPSIINTTLTPKEQQMSSNTATEMPPSTLSKAIKFGPFTVTSQVCFPPSSSPLYLTKTNIHRSSTKPPYPTVS